MTLSGNMIKQEAVLSAISAHIKKLNEIVPTGNIRNDGSGVVKAAKDKFDNLKITAIKELRNAKSFIDAENIFKKQEVIIQAAANALTKVRTDTELSQKIAQAKVSLENYAKDSLPSLKTGSHNNVPALLSAQKLLLEKSTISSLSSALSIAKTKLLAKRNEDNTANQKDADDKTIADKIKEIQGLHLTVPSGTSRLSDGHTIIQALINKHLTGALPPIDETITYTYTIHTASTGVATLQVSLSKGNAKGTVSIAIPGFKTDADITKEQDQKDVDALLNALKDSSVTVNHKIVVATDTSLTQTSAQNLGITLPSVRQGITLTYSHPELNTDGDLSVVVSATAGTGANKYKKTKTVTFKVTGIDQSIVTAAVNALTETSITGIDKSKLSSDPSQAPSVASVNGVQFTLTHTDTDGQMNILVTGNFNGKTFSKVTGIIITDFKSVLSDALAKEATKFTN